MLVPDTGAALARDPPRRCAPAAGSRAAVWDAVERNPWAPALWDVLERMTDLPPARPGGPGMFSLGRRRTGCARSLTAAGFGDVQIEPIPVAWRYPDFETYWRTQSSLNGALSPAPADAAGDRARRGCADAVREAVEPFRDGRRLPRAGLGAGRRRHGVTR